jgi:hypothetical protein
MLGMVKLYIKGFVEVCREIFQRRIVTADVSMANSAHWYLRSCELAPVAFGARFVTGEAWRGGIVSAFVARVAGKGTVFLARVKEF